MKRKIISYVSLFVLLNSPLATPVVTVLAAEGNDSVQSDTTQEERSMSKRLNTKTRSLSSCFGIFVCGSL